MSKSLRSSYCLYVVELAPAVWKTQQKIRKANPQYKPETGKGCLYVGMTSSTPAERFRAHKRGGLSSASVVKDYGCYLRPKLYERYARMSQGDAEEMEPYLAERLRRKGFAVWPIKPGGAFTMDGGPTHERPASQRRRHVPKLRPVR